MLAESLLVLDASGDGFLGGTGGFGLGPDFQGELFAVKVAEENLVPEGAADGVGGCAAEGRSEVAESRGREEEACLTEGTTCVRGAGSGGEALDGPEAIEVQNILRAGDICGNLGEEEGAVVDGGLIGGKAVRGEGAGNREVGIDFPEALDGRGGDVESVAAGGLVGGTVEEIEFDGGGEVIVAEVPPMSCAESLR